MTGAPLPPCRIVRFDEFALDLRVGELSRAGQRIPLHDQPFRILVRLLERPGDLITRDELRQELWPGETFVSFEQSLNNAVSRLRQSLGDSADVPRYIETLPKRGYRFIGALTSDAPVEADGAASGRRSVLYVWSAAVVIVTTLLLWWVVGRIRSHDALRPSGDEGIAILVADIVNHTGDAVFDGSLKLAIRVAFEQSPSFRLIPGERVRQTLKEMTRSPDAQVAGDVALELCQRAEGRVVLTGSIARLGTRYTVGLEAVDCESRDVIVEQQRQAGDRDHVLETLGSMAVEARRRLGDSAANLQRFSVPIAQATTSSLEALKAFSVAEQIDFERGDVEAEPFYLRAIDLDHEFALAYARLSGIYGDTGRPEKMRQFAVEAYARRERVSELERLAIDSRYCGAVLLAKEPYCYVSIYELWTRTYPLDWDAHSVLAMAYAIRGDYTRAVPIAAKSVRLGPDRWGAYANLAASLTALNRFDEAKKVTDAALAHHVQTPAIHGHRFVLAFATGDPAGMAAERAASVGSTEEYDLVDTDSKAAIFEGRRRDAQVLRLHAEQLTKERFPEWIAATRSFAAMADAAIGIRPCETPPDDAGSGNSKPRQWLVAALLCEDNASADRLLQQTPPNAPITSPARALMAARAGHPGALDQLPAARPEELGLASGFRPVYLRGLAYLAAGNGSAASREFQRIIDQRGVAITSPLYPLAYVQQARAYVLAGDVGSARTAYESFFTLWEHADPDVPILIAAKAEYTALTSRRMPPRSRDETR